MKLTTLRFSLVYVGQGIADLVLPSHCLACEQPLDTPQLVCATCLDTFEAIEPPRCRKCGKPMGKYSETRRRCSDCKRHPLLFDQATAPWVYDEVVRDLVLKLKFCRATLVADFFAEQMASHLGEMSWRAAIDLVQPVPMHWAKAFWRGYNQAELLARGVCQRVQLPFSRSLKKGLYTPPQSRLSRSSRLANLEGAFRVRPRDSVKGKRILLVDDVLTTGTTCSECARVLKAAGAKKVFVLTAARAR